MSDHEMQFFPEAGGEQGEFARKNWSSEQPSVPPELSPAYCHLAEEKVDKQSIERVWDRLEEHVLRNRECYYHNRNVPSLLLQAPRAFSSHRSGTHRRSVRFLRELPWRRLDMIAAMLFVTLLVGTLLTAICNVQPQTQSGAPGNVSLSTQEICKGVMAAKQRVTLVKGTKGIEMFPPMIIMRQGGQLVWSNQTSTDQVVVDASTKAGAMIVSWQTKEQDQTLQKADTYTYYVQSTADQPSKLSSSETTKSSRLVVKVLSIVVIVPGEDGIGNAFKPSAMKIPQGGDLVWLNTTPEPQVIVNTIRKQEAPFSLSPNSCQLQHDIQQGRYSYALQGSKAQFSLNAE